MNSSYNQNKKTFIVVLIIFALIGNYTIFSKIITNQVPKADYSKYEQVIKEDSPEEKLRKDLQNNFVTVSANMSDTKCGELILINTSHAYDFDAKTSLFSQQFPESIYDYKADGYFVKDRNVALNKVAIDALNQLLTDFVSETGKKTVIIVDGYRSYEMQQLVLNAKIDQLGEEQGRLIATNPGESEHHTGYALDMSLYVNGVRETYDGTGDYEWITNNCYKYGFVIRYPENKTDITGITYEPWHLRYVGKPHAEYMTKNGICLEEYQAKLSLYPVQSGRLNFTSENGNTYMIYSCKVENDGTQIYVPKNLEYTLSGDNAGNIIVTALVSKGEAQATPPEDPTPEQ